MKMGLRKEVCRGCKAYARGFREYVKGFHERNEEDRENKSGNACAALMQKAKSTYTASRIRPLQYVPYVAHLLFP